ncbi:hypothetical protein TWF281_004074 [Arthrobotrys megalospora]
MEKPMVHAPGCGSGPSNLCEVCKDTPSIPSIIASDALERTKTIFSFAARPLALFQNRLSFLPLMTILPRSLAQNVVMNDTAIAQDVSEYIAALKFSEWRDVANSIRDVSSRADCNYKLGVALAALGPNASASANGSAGALTLLPTVGAILGSPTKELWLLYKLMPLAGVTSMLLSLGGTIVPAQTSEYQVRNPNLRYDEVIAAPLVEQKPVTKVGTGESGEGGAGGGEEKEPHTGISETLIFRRAVSKRARSWKGGRSSWRVWVGIILQIFLLAVLLLACGLLQAGAVIVWWCQEPNWMFFWYGIMAISTILANVAGVPFSRQLTIRVSRCPKVEIDPEARDLRSSDNILSELSDGINVKAHIRIVPEPHSESRVPFFVIISEDSVGLSHEILRIISKFLSVAVFATGTAMFASATLTTISITLVTLCLVLTAGVFGRVVALWMASEMMKDEPILHKVVKRGEAGEYLKELLLIDNITIEVMGHIIVNGRCIGRTNKWLKWSTITGVLAAPYNLEKLSLESGVIASKQKRENERKLEELGTEVSAKLS